MATRLTLFAILSLSSGVFSCDEKYQPPYNKTQLAPDYYWRDYNGMIPNDAIEGGLDDVGNVTYIGQVLQGNSLLPATIYAGKQSALASAYNQIFHSGTAVKILCAQNRERFKWIPATTTDMRLLTDYSFVIGGIEVGFILNIGRVNFEQRLIIGKVFSGRGGLSGLWIPKKNGKEEHLDTFQVLAYDYFTFSRPNVF